MTMNNIQAKISQGQAIYLPSTSAEGTKQDKVDATLSLEVTPHITPDGSISMKITAKNDAPGIAPPGATAAINKKEANTELLVKNGETTVIGGIFVDSDQDSSSGVPYLMDIPLLGWLFKSNQKIKSKNVESRCAGGYLHTSEMVGSGPGSMCMPNNGAPPCEEYRVLSLTATESPVSSAKGSPDPYRE